MGQQQSKRRSPKYNKNPRQNVKLKEAGFCKKIAYDLKTANRIAGQRESLTGLKIGVYLCHDGCSGQSGKGVYHLTRSQGRKNRKSTKKGPIILLNPKPSRKQRKAFEFQAFSAWESEGGALHSRDLET